MQRQMFFAAFFRAVAAVDFIQLGVLFEMLADMVRNGGVGCGGSDAEGAVGRGGQACGYCAQAGAEFLPVSCLALVFRFAELSVIALLFQAVHFFVDCIFGRLHIATEILRYFPLHIQFFLHLILLKAVVQTA